ncbi:sensor histidine kinase [Jiella marina]|uniref:sensor histidine kinase n=1 Tax=Jiella sp. LLJ827 TaxID=2917712 RepID=UPI002101783F|nr:sensor histidine kinase [Jiella sp. LLJ827]MCQ0987402.1 sensor histidine kinase [Jiella sp. LLJ827]
MRLRRHIRYVRIALFTAIATSALAILLFGWVGGFYALTGASIGGARMTPSTAIGFFLLSAAIAILDLLCMDMRRGRGAIAIGIVSGVVVLVVLASFAGGSAGSPLDGLLLSLSFSTGERPSGYLSPATAACFFCAIAALGVRSSSSDRLQKAFTPLVTSGLAIGSVALASYLVQPTALRDVDFFAAMSLQTAVLAVLLFIGLMLLAEDRGWIWLFFGSGAGSKGARRLFPILIFGPLCVAVLALAGSRAGWFDEDFRVAFLAVMMMAGGLAALLATARVQNRNELRLKQFIAELEAANSDKNVLIREVYHRVKNNLQQMDALLWTEARKHKDVSVRDSFDAMSSRVRAIGLVHQLLLKRENLSTVQLAAFLETLVETIAKAGDLDGRKVTITVEASADEASLSTATTIGLLVNEIVSNAAKHAFQGRETGQIRVSLTEDAEDPEFRHLVVEDDGIGMGTAWPPDPRQGGTGSRLISSLVKQLRGSVQIQEKGGTKIMIRFPRSLLQEAR